MNITEFKIRGLTPLLMHNGHLADPLSEPSKALARLTKKKDKTEADHLAIRKCEWYGSLYVNEDRKPCITGEMLEACLEAGARRFKLGRAVKGGLIIDGNFVLDYEGPKEINKLWEHGGFIKITGVRNKQNRVIRTRPMFPKWELTFEVQWDPMDIKDEEQLAQIVEAGGRCGIGDYRPKFGRFELVED